MRVTLIFPSISHFGVSDYYSGSYTSPESYTAGARIKTFYSFLFGHKVNQFSLILQNDKDIEVYDMLDTSDVLGIFEEFTWHIKSSSGQVSIGMNLRFNAQKGTYIVEGSQIKVSNLALKYYNTYIPIYQNSNAFPGAIRSKASTSLEFTGDVLEFNTSHYYDYLASTNEKYSLKAAIPSSVTWKLGNTSPAWHFALDVKGVVEVNCLPDTTYFKNSKTVRVSPYMEKTSFPNAILLVFSPNSITKPASNIIQGEIRTAVDLREDYPVKSPGVEVTGIPVTEDDEVSFFYNYGGVVYYKLAFPILPVDKCLKSFRPFELIDCPKATFYKKLSARVAFLLTYYTIGNRSLPPVTATLYRKEESFLLHIPYKGELSFPPFAYLDEIKPIPFEDLRRLYEPFVEKLNRNTVYLLGGIEGYAGISTLPGSNDSYTFKAYVMAAEQEVPDFPQYEGEIGEFKVWSRTLSYTRREWTTAQFSKFFPGSVPPQVAVLLPFTKA